MEKVATRYQTSTFFVSDGGIRPSQNPLIEVIIVPRGMDAADNWIIDQCERGDVVITDDILLADRVVKAGIKVLKPDGTTLTEQSIGLALAMRNLMTDLRQTGQVQGNGRPFSRNDRSRFLQALDGLLQSG